MASEKGNEWRPIDVLCTMGTPNCADELLLFLRCARAYHPVLPIVVGCTSSMLSSSTGRPAEASTLAPFASDDGIRWVPCLDGYGLALDRTTMTRRPGVWYPTRHDDFMMEKSNLMELGWSLAHGRGAGEVSPMVAFLDCDVLLLQPLPLLPRTAVLGLSPHGIRPADEALFGRYNGGFVALSDPALLCSWRRHTHTSRFHDQASLEDVAAEEGAGGGPALYGFPPQHNYGYWRMLQAPAGPEVEVKRFSIQPRGDTPVKTLCYDGSPLASVHTHLFTPRTPSAPRDVVLFNGVVTEWLSRCASAGAAGPVGCAGANLFYRKLLNEWLRVAV